MSRTIKTYLAALFEVGRRRIAWALLLMVLLSITEGFGIALVLPLLQAAGMNLEHQGGLSRYARLVTEGFRAAGLTPSLGVLLMLLAMLAGARAVLGRFQSAAVYSVQSNLGLVLRCALYRAVAEANWPFLSRMRNSDLVHALTAEVGRTEAATFYAMSLAANLLLFAVYLGIAFRLSVTMTLLVLASGGALVLLVTGRTERLRRAGERYSAGTRSVYAAAVEHLNGLKTAKAYGAQERNFKIFSDFASELAKTSVEQANHQAAAVSLFEMGSTVILGVVLYVAIRLMAVPPAAVLILLLMFVRVLPRVISCHYHYRSFLNALPAFANIASLRESCEAAAEHPAGSGRLGFAEAVRFERVSFTYEAEKGPAVRDADMVIPAARVVALVGPSGAGKSTVADLLMGLLKPEAGRITVDGVTLDAAHGRAWRERIGYVAQDTFLFHDTIRANLAWAQPGATDREIRDALGFAAADEFVSRLPQGLETVIGDRGVLLSHGERQRLALARALLRRPALLILDEATNSLDSENENRILETLEALRGTVTIFVIAHRLSTVRTADLIYVIEDGKVIESGGWEELIAAGGRFYALCQAQGIAREPLRAIRPAVARRS